MVFLDFVACCLKNCRSLNLPSLNARLWSRFNWFDILGFLPGSLFLFYLQRVLNKRRLRNKYGDYCIILFLITIKEEGNRNRISRLLWQLVKRNPFCRRLDQHSFCWIVACRKCLQLLFFCFSFAFSFISFLVHVLLLKFEYRKQKWHAHNNSYIL